MLLELLELRSENQLLHNRLEAVSARPPARPHTSGAAFSGRESLGTASARKAREPDGRSTRSPGLTLGVNGQQRRSLTQSTSSSGMNRARSQTLSIHHDADSGRLLSGKSGSRRGGGSLIPSNTWQLSACRQLSVPEAALVLQGDGDALAHRCSTDSANHASAGLEFEPSRTAALRPHTAQASYEQRASGGAMLASPLLLSTTGRLMGSNTLLHGDLHDLRSSFSSRPHSQPARLET